MRYCYNLVIETDGSDPEAWLQQVLGSWFSGPNQSIHLELKDFYHERRRVSEGVDWNESGT
tara:strand:+ start:363 stop:545 length:183 start_codon:yes stop_codon:yes gene_type:complete